MTGPLLAAALACFLLPPEPIQDELRGFTRSPTEHIINRFDQPIRTSRFEGLVTDSGGAPMEGVLVEVRGPGSATRISGRQTNARGRFRLRGLAAGSYRFKITRNGFQSILGELTIAPGAPREAAEFLLQPGV